MALSMKITTVVGGLLSAMFLLAAARSAAAESGGTPRIWDIPFGTAAATLDAAGFLEPSCGTNGGPAGKSLESFTHYASCPAGPWGLYEIWFRYDDTLEYMARAIRDPVQIARNLATAVAGQPVVLSFLLDADGHVRGYRIFSDSRAPEDLRAEAHVLSATLRALLGEGWQCQDLPPAAGEEPILRVFVKQDCTLTTDMLTATTKSRYLRKPGQHLVDPATGQPIANAFESSAQIEVVQNRPFADEEAPAAAASSAQSIKAYETPREAFLAGATKDCPGCDLVGADLRRRDLTGADLSGADLSRATLHRVALRRADLSGATLAGANLNLADISLADFTDADLQSALLFRARGTQTIFDGANLHGARMGEIGLRRASFVGAYISGTDLGGADLNDADFSDAVLSGSYLYQTRLVRADLSGVVAKGSNFVSAVLRGGDLSGATFTNADFQYADLREADLTNADFSGVRLEFANLRNTVQTGADFTNALMPR